MTGDSTLFDIPPPIFGRYRAQQQIGVGATGPVFRAEDPETHQPVVIKALQTSLSPEVNQQVVDDLAAVIDRQPSHPSIVPLRAAGLSDDQPYVVSDLVAGDPLDLALEQFGPGAISDLLPRVRMLADALDRAAEHELYHGALHPRDVIVSNDATFITGIGVAPILGRRGMNVPFRPPYSAPEIGQGEAPTAASDQYSLAVLTFEWLFGEPVYGPANIPLEVPELPDVDAERLADAFTTALAPEPSERFANCRDFVYGLAAAAPLISQPFKERLPDVPLRLESAAESASLFGDEIDTPLAIKPTATEPDLTLAPAFSISSVFAAVPSGSRFGLGALAATLFLGMGVGLAGGYAASRTLWPLGSEPSVSPAPAPRPSAGPRPTGSTPAAPEPKSGTDVPVASAPVAPSPKATVAPPPPAKEAVLGRLQIRSTPDGATVQIDGQARGVTPLSLTDLQLGARTVKLSRNGYVDEERRVTLSKGRPSQSLDVSLSRARTAAATRPAPTAPAPGRPAAGALGGLTVDSHPRGAAVTVNGVMRGTTPITIGRIPPGDYTVTMRLTKYQPISMVVQVKAGEQARAAATLTEAK